MKRESNQIKSVYPPTAPSLAATPLVWLGKGEQLKAGLHRGTEVKIASHHIARF